MGIFREINMSLTERSHRKQILGIILVVVFLLGICVLGTRGYRASKAEYSFFGPKKVLTEVETCQAENGQCPLEVKAVR